jgi:large subunit ribosomal protein L17
MHRHGYKGRKFGRERDQRHALMVGLMRSLFIHTAIETTLPKAKSLRPMAEKLVTKARNGGLTNRRAIIAALGNDMDTAHRLVDVIAPQLKRDSGYLRIVRSDTMRVGDNAEIVRIEFVDDIKDEVPAAKSSETTKKETN